MKTVNQMLVATIALLALGTAVSTRAGEPFLSPRGRANQIRVVPGTASSQHTFATNLPVAGHNVFLSPKASTMENLLRTVPSTGPSIDLAHAPRPTLSPKDPGYEVALRENAVRQIAPLR
jgi:hypothetical protein